MGQKKYLFIDRDGTLIREPADEQVDRLDKVSLLTGVIPALLKLKAAGYRFVMVTNQDGLGSASFPEADFRLCQDFVVSLFKSQGVTFDDILVCPHFPGDGCSCRKPALGLVASYLRRQDMDFARSAVIGDRATDLALAEAMAIKGFLVGDDATDDVSDWATIAHELVAMPRRATVSRTTRETAVTVSVDLDLQAEANVATGIGFFDHMLEQLGKHGGFALSVAVKGDLDVDEHHTVEDTALALGSALKEALGDKVGIERYGFLLAMDEASAQVAIDLCGRPYFVFAGQFEREAVGGLPTELVPHFFRSLTDALGATLHIKLTGENSHHKIEAAFKGVARALGQAIRRDEKMGLPSTKGVL